MSKSLNTIKLDIDHRMASHSNLEIDLECFEDKQSDPNEIYKYKKRIFQEKLFYKKWEISNNLDHLKDLFDRYPEVFEIDKRYREFFDKHLKHHC